MGRPDVRFIDKCGSAPLHSVVTVPCRATLSAVGGLVVSHLLTGSGYKSASVTSGFMILRRMTTSTMRPIVAVIGTTGVGKSQLAVSLAQSLSTGLPDRRMGGSGANAEAGPSKAVVLSADSMQLYKGLDVITNKVTHEEMGGVEHWGLDVVTPGQGGSWEVGKWCGEADRLVSLRIC